MCATIEIGKKFVDDYRGGKFELLRDILENKNCFKLVCGAGNEDAIEVEKLVALYSKAGCRFFDLCAKSEIVDAAKRGLDYSIPKEEQDEFYFCVSVGIKGDPHVSKAVVDDSLCINCTACKNGCLQNAIIQDENSCKIDKIRCIGCAKCSALCFSQAISFISENKNLKEVLPPLIEKGIDCIELHVLGEDENEVDEKWDDINNCFDGLTSICVDRSKLGNEKLLKRINRMLSVRKPYTTIIQADGAPMSGGEDDFKTTLQTIATAEIIQDANLPVYILLSGGTNSKTTVLANQCGIVANGISMGSYARKIVREYIDKDDFLDNPEVFEKALAIAKQLIDVSMVTMQNKPDEVLINV